MLRSLSLTLRTSQPAAGFKDASGMWQNVYEYDGFEETLHKLWLQLEPLYKEMHAYVRSRLREQYGDKIKADGPIPAHLLGKRAIGVVSVVHRFLKQTPASGGCPY